MKTPKWLYGFALIGLAALTAACGGSAEPNGGGSPSEPDFEEQPVQAFEAGTLISTEGGRWLITAYVEGADGAYIDASALAVGDNTIFRSGSGETVDADSFKPGSLVEAWRTGPLRESYPTQADAYTLVLLDAGEQSSGDSISRNAAVQAAFQSQTDDAGIQAVKSAELDEAGGYWTIELVRFEAVDQPLVLRIDAGSGDIIPVLVAENDAFRVFAPQQDTEAAPGFTVEGEARVFEAAFSWTLEDGHFILAEGHEMADVGAPEWGKFSFDVGYEYASQPHMTLILYVNSAKDGSMEHQLVIPLKAPEELIRYSGDQS